MDRRSFILGTSALASQLLVGCADNNQAKLNVQLLKGSIPGQVVNQFSKSLQQKAQLKFAPVGQLQDLFDQLQTWQGKTKNTDGKGWLPSLRLPQFQKTVVADLVTLADYTLKEAIEQKLIQPLEESQLKQWSALPEPWQKLVRRNDQGNLDAQGKIWAAPYRWGSTVIVYRRDKFKKPPKDWTDLWQSECKGRISLLDQPREVIGIVLKKLGKSYNTENLDKVPSLEKELRTLNQQVKFYASDKYLEPLIIGDTWLAVAWSSDVVRMLTRYPELAAIIPESGTAMWSDLWVRPVGGKSALSSEWIDFCWTPNIAKQISLLTKTNSPISTDIATFDIQEPLRNLLVSNSQFFDKNEYLLPLSQSTQKQYQDLFTRIKNEG
ncbi:extracellular solute-binding protein [Hassallia byssoidea VB512170]|uniref:Extracellular solute-binding protein n=1 Tax=Hassallia byssoidea VB512170 TaxID=1304833 RepID=A0A846H6I1_9CYAN|nr:extracellular solute-binding protein [Hassalia byssoidea]NEU73267.1 extracellular solute-binding protein [Hassalia byssoidea VB512170]